MKRDLQLLVATTLLVALIGGVPTFLHWKKEREIQTLVARPPAPATRVLRRALASATEVRIHVQAVDTYSPNYYPNQAAVAFQLRKPTVILQGREMQELIAALHAERQGESGWHAYDSSQPEPLSIETASALEFYTGSKWIADIRVGDSYGLRWYSPPQYKADAPLLLESRRYLQYLGLYKHQSGAVF